MSNFSKYMVFIIVFLCIICSYNINAQTLTEDLQTTLNKIKKTLLKYNIPSISGRTNKNDILTINLSTSIEDVSRIINEKNEFVKFFFRLSDTLILTIRLQKEGENNFLSSVATTKGESTVESGGLIGKEKAILKQKEFKYIPGIVYYAKLQISNKEGDRTLFGYRSLKGNNPKDCWQLILKKIKPPLKKSLDNFITISGNMDNAFQRILYFNTLFNKIDNPQTATNEVKNLTLIKRVYQHHSDSKLINGLSRFKIEINDSTDRNISYMLPGEAVLIPFVLENGQWKVSIYDSKIDITASGVKLRNITGGTYLLNRLGYSNGRFVPYNNILVKLKSGNKDQHLGVVHIDENGDDKKDYQVAVKAFSNLKFDNSGQPSVKLYLDFSSDFSDRLPFEFPSSVIIKGKHTWLFLNQTRLIDFNEYDVNNWSSKLDPNDRHGKIPIKFHMTYVLKGKRGDMAAFDRDMSPVLNAIESFLDDYKTSFSKHQYNFFLNITWARKLIHKEEFAIEFIKMGQRGNFTVNRLLLIMSELNRKVYYEMLKNFNMTKQELTAANTRSGRISETQKLKITAWNNYNARAGNKKYSIKF